MLVLSRKIDQTTVIGGNITVTVLGIDRNSVKLGFQAPDDVGILREELVGNEAKPHRPHKKTEGMLIITRKVDEGVFIGKDILVKILGIERDRVKVGTEAPSDVRIVRGELITEGIEGRAHRSKEEL